MSQRCRHLAELSVNSDQLTVRGVVSSMMRASRLQRLCIHGNAHLQVIAVLFAMWKGLAMMMMMMMMTTVFSERELYAIARPSVVCLSVVCNVRAPYSAGSNFRQYFYGIRYLGYPLTFYGDRPRGTPPPGELNTRGVAEYSDFRPIDGYISETVQDRLVS